MEELRSVVDTLITIPNERLLQAADRNLSLSDAFKMADDILRQAVQGISDLITVPGFINVDFADVRAIMKGMGIALMGTGSAVGENRAMDATQRAISSPLLEEASIDGAKGVLVNITGGADLTLFEVDEAMKVIHDAADPEANIILGTVPDERMQNEMKITVIATGFERQMAEKIHSMPLRANSVGGSSNGQTRNAAASASNRVAEDLDVPTFIRKKAD
jgi:cell division protein FtsZ